MEWTEERIAYLRSLWDEGLSTAEIGRKLEISKNAVVGKAHRLKLPPRPSPIKNRPASEGRKPAAPRKKRITEAKNVSELPLEGGASGKNSQEVAKKPSSSKEPIVPLGGKSVAEKNALLGKSQVENRQEALLKLSALQLEEKSRLKADADNHARNFAGREERKLPLSDIKEGGRPDIAVMPRAYAGSAPVRKAAPVKRERDPLEKSLRQGLTCQWPHGNPGEPGFHFCGAGPLPGKPYCAEHAAIAYVKIRDRRE